MKLASTRIKLASTSKDEAGLNKDEAGLLNTTKYINTLPIAIHTANRIQVASDKRNIKKIFTNMLIPGR